jgi:hypothetical protein
LAFRTARAIRLGRWGIFRGLGSLFGGWLFAAWSVFRTTRPIRGTTRTTPACCRSSCRFGLAARLADLPVPAFECVPVIVFRLVSCAGRLGVLCLSGVLNDDLFSHHFDNGFDRLDLRGRGLARCPRLAGWLGRRFVIDRGFNLGELHRRGAFNGCIGGSGLLHIVVVIVVKCFQQPSSEAIIVIITWHPNPRHSLARLFDLRGSGFGLGDGCGFVCGLRFRLDNSLRHGCCRRF